MSNKQDRQGVRTPTDVERKYLLTLEKSFAEVLGIATDARMYAVKTDERLSEEVARLVTKIEETAEGIVLSVSDTYATNESVDSKIQLKSGEILLSVEGKYETQDNATQKYAALGLKLDEQGVTISEQAKLISGNTSNIGTLTTKVDNNSASISQQAETINSHTNSIAALTTKTDNNSASITQQAKLISANSSSIALTNTQVAANKASIESQASVISGHTSSIAGLTASVNNHSASISQQAALISGNTTNISNIQTQVNNQGSKINLIVDSNNTCNASFVLSAINAQSSATLNASKINFLTDSFVINDTSNNLLFSAGKNKVTFGGWNVGNGYLYSDAMILPDTRVWKFNDTINLKPTIGTPIEWKLDFTSSGDDFNCIRCSAYDTGYSIEYRLIYYYFDSNGTQLNSALAYDSDAGGWNTAYQTIRTRNMNSAFYDIATVIEETGPDTKVKITPYSVGYWIEGAGDYYTSVPWYMIVRALMGLYAQGILSEYPVFYDHNL